MTRQHRVVERPCNLCQEMAYQCSSVGEVWRFQIRSSLMIPSFESYNWTVFSCPNLNFSEEASKSPLSSCWRFSHYSYSCSSLAPWSDNFPWAISFFPIIDNSCCLESSEVLLLLGWWVFGPSKDYNQSWPDLSLPCLLFPRWCIGLPSDAEQALLETMCQSSVGQGVTGDDKLMIQAIYLECSWF